LEDVPPKDEVPPSDFWKLSEWRKALRTKRKALEHLRTECQEIEADLAKEESAWDDEMDRLSNRLDESTS
jgi:hypothetical protein